MCITEATITFVMFAESWEKGFNLKRGKPTYLSMRFTGTKTCYASITERTITCANMPSAPCLCLKIVLCRQSTMRLLTERREQPRLCLALVCETTTRKKRRRVHEFLRFLINTNQKSPAKSLMPHSISRIRT